MRPVQCDRADCVSNATINDRLRFGRALWIGAGENKAHVQRPTCRPRHPVLISCFIPFFGPFADRRSQGLRQSRLN